MSFLILIKSLFSGSLFNYYRILFWAYLFPPSIYEIAHSKIELASVILLQILPLIKEVINEAIPHYFNLSCKFVILSTLCYQSSAYHSSIYLTYSSAYCYCSFGYLSAASPMCYYFVGYICFYFSPSLLYFFLFY